MYIIYHILAPLSSVHCPSGPGPKMSLQLKQDTDEVTDNEYLEAVGLPMIKVGWGEVFENEMVDREITKTAKIFFQTYSIQSHHSSNLIPKV